MKRKELKAEVNKRIKAVKREVERMNDLLIEHHALLTVEDWRDLANRMDDALRANRTMVWMGMADTNANPPAPESTEGDAALAQNPELPMMILGVLGMGMTRFADSQIQQIRDAKEASWVPPSIEVETPAEGDAPAGIENAPESE